MIFAKLRMRPHRWRHSTGLSDSFPPARYGHKAIVKHLPDKAFAIDEQLYRRIGRRFEPELSLWVASDRGRMVAVATFGVSDPGVPAIVLPALP